jgi:molybdopterin synthase catalytic subunit
MSIRVQLFAAFAEFAGSRELEWDFVPGLTCEKLWRELQVRYPRMSRIPALFAIQDEYVPAGSELKDGDSLMIFPPVSGGAASFIYEQPLSLDRALAAIQDENGGGEAIFIGRVRRWSEGKRIRHLFYECHVPMADSEIQKIIDEIKDRWPVLKVHIEHRTGKLEVGEVAVVVAVSSEHRKEAIEACRYGIDELKHRVPIWKKEVSEDGEEWVGACEERHE